MKTITQAEIKTLREQGLNVRIQSNNLVFIGKKVITHPAVIEHLRYVALREEVYQLIPIKARTPA